MLKSDYDLLVIEIDALLHKKELDIEHCRWFNSRSQCSLRRAQRYNKCMLTWYRSVVIPNNLFFRHKLLHIHMEDSC